MGLVSELGEYSNGVLAIAGVGIILGYVVLKLFYNAFLHPLRKYPGPPLAGATRLWYCYYCTKGTLRFALHDAHKKYGGVVRIAPDELSYADPKAWNDIYGHRIGKGELAKDPIFYSSQSSGPNSIINSDRTRHGVLRKQASHGFSERALRTREHVIRDYADLMLSRLEESISIGKEVVDIVDWYNFFTFDVMGDMVFGQSFDCLTNWGYHPWVKLIFDSVKAAAFVRCAKYFSLLRPIADYLVPPNIYRRRVEQRRMAREKADFRRSLDDGREDLISGFLKEKSGVTAQEYQSTVATLIIAGSETTATLMSGLTYYVLRDAERKKKVEDEIRGAFSSLSEITFVSVNKLPYLLACLDEALRIYPPVPDTFPRRTGSSEETICGQVVPPHTVVGVHQWSTHHSAKSFKNPDEFVPERWIDESREPEYENDKRDAVQPFLVGPRNCLGRNLAYFEMRLLLARVFWRFDMELQPQSAKWNDHKTYLLWEKPPMYVKLKVREGSSK